MDEIYSIELLIGSIVMIVGYIAAYIANGKYVRLALILGDIYGVITSFHKARKALLEAQEDGVVDPEEQEEYERLASYTLERIAMLIEKYNRSVSKR